jgi:hypothetical protein
MFCLFSTYICIFVKQYLIFVFLIRVDEFFPMLQVEICFLSLLSGFPAVKRPSLFFWHFLDSKSFQEILNEGFGRRHG